MSMLPPVVGRLVGDSTEYVRSLKQAETATDQTAKSTSKSFNSMATSLTKVVGTGALLTFGKNARDMASDVAEAGSKVGVVFGAARTDVDAFAASSATAFGVSKREALSAAGTFGNLFTATGLAKEAAAGMSVDVVKLGADLGSFNNLGTDEVLEKLRSGLVGEIEPLRALGINFNAAQVEAKGMEMGLADANGELSEGAKVQARYALILEQTKSAQGDFARTSEGMANSGKIAAAQAEDTSSTFGESLAPAMAKANKMLSAALNLFNDLPSSIQQVTIGIGLATAAVTLLGGRTAAWTVITKAAAAAQWLFNAALTANPIGLVVLALAALAAGLVYAYHHSETFRNAVNSLGGAFVFMKNVAIDAISNLIDTWLGAVEWIIRGAARAFGWVPGVGPKLREAAAAVEGFRDDANHFLAGIRDKNINVNLNTDAFWAEWNRVASATRTATAVQLQAPGVGTSGPQRYHDGGIVGGHGEVPILAEGGEGVFTRGQMAALGVAMGSAGRGSGAGARGGNTYILQVTSTTGDIPDSTIRKIRSQLFELENDVPAGQIVP